MQKPLLAEKLLPFFAHCLQDEMELANEAIAAYCSLQPCGLEPHKEEHLEGYALLPSLNFLTKKMHDDPTCRLDCCQILLRILKSNKEGFIPVDPEDVLVHFLRLLNLYEDRWSKSMSQLLLVTVSPVSKHDLRFDLSNIQLGQSGGRHDGQPGV